MKGYIKESYQGGVYSRLYLDSTVRKRKQENISKQSSGPIEIISRARTKIENTLMLKHAKSQAKINTLRYKQQLKETEGITSVPKINKISREIVQIKEGTSEAVSLYTTKLLNSSRSSSAIKMTPKQSFLSLIDLKQAAEPGGKRKVIRVVEEEKVEEDYVPKEYAAVQISKGKFRADEEEIENIRKQVFDKCKVPEPLPVKKSMLSMSVIERNQQWLETKKLRIDKQKEENVMKETDGCTFSPRLNDRINTSVDSRKKSLSFLTSYTERYMNASQASVTAGKKSETPVVKDTRSKATLYKAISPHERTFSQGGSLKLLQGAKLMASYNHL